MGHYNDSILKVDQELLQPFDGIQVQVVGRLIQKKNIRIAEQSLCKKNFYFLANRTLTFWLPFKSFIMA